VRETPEAPARKRHSIALGNWQTILTRYVVVLMKPPISAMANRIATVSKISSQADNRVKRVSADNKVSKASKVSPATDKNDRSRGNNKVVSKAVRRLVVHRTGRDNMAAQRGALKEMPGAITDSSAPSGVNAYAKLKISVGNGVAEQQRERFDNSMTLLND